jgi:heme exporter protein D
MINELFFMNGYGAYVLSAFGFTLLSFVSLYFVTKTQFVREQKKFIAKFGSLETEKAELAKSQRINKEILADATNS